MQLQDPVVLKVTAKSWLYIYYIACTTKAGDFLSQNKFHWSSLLIALLMCMEVMQSRVRSLLRWRYRAGAEYSYLLLDERESCRDQK